MNLVGVRRIALVWSVLSLLPACRKPPSEQRATTHSNAHAAAAATTAGSGATTATAPSASSTPSLQTPEGVLAEWTRALNQADAAALERLYAERVRFYGQNRSRAQVVAAKREALAATPTFTQSILGTPNVERGPASTRLSFHKRSGAKGKENDVLGTLVLGGSPPLIQEESDAATDKLLRPKVEKATPPDDCSSAVWYLVDSTREAKRLFQQIEENLKDFPEEADLHPGGVGPFDPEATGDGTYEVIIGVHHPERFESYGFFSVDPAGQVTVSAFALDLLDAVVQTPPEALAHFKRLCAASKP